MGKNSQNGKYVKSKAKAKSDNLKAIEKQEKSKLDKKSANKKKLIVQDSIPAHSSPVKKVSLSTSVSVSAQSTQKQNIVGLNNSAQRIGGARTDSCASCDSCTPSTSGAVSTISANSSTHTPAKEHVAPGSAQSDLSETQNVNTRAHARDNVSASATQHIHPNTFQGSLGDSEVNIPTQHKVNEWRSMPIDKSGTHNVLNTSPIYAPAAWPKSNSNQLLKWFLQNSYDNNTAGASSTSNTTTTVNNSECIDLGTTPLTKTSVDSLSSERLSSQSATIQGEEKINEIIECNSVNMNDNKITENTPRTCGETSTDARENDSNKKKQKQKKTLEAATNVVVPSVLNDGSEHASDDKGVVNDGSDASLEQHTSTEKPPPFVNLGSCPKMTFGSAQNIDCTAQLSHIQSLNKSDENSRKFNFGPNDPDKVILTTFDFSKTITNTKYPETILEDVMDEDDITRETSLIKMATSDDSLFVSLEELEKAKIVEKRMNEELALREKNLARMRTISKARDRKRQEVQIKRQRLNDQETDRVRAIHQLQTCNRIVIPKDNKTPGDKGTATVTVDASLRKPSKLGKPPAAAAAVSNNGRPKRQREKPPKLKGTNNDEGFPPLRSNRTSLAESAVPTSDSVIPLQNKFHLLREPERGSKRRSTRRLSEESASEEDDNTALESDVESAITLTSVQSTSSAPIKVQQIASNRASNKSRHILAAHAKRDAAKSEASEAPTAKEPKVPPLVVTDMHPRLSIRAICDTVASGLFSLRNISIGYKVFAKTNDAYVKIADALKNNSLDFFSHPSPSSACFRSICKGMPELDIQEIIEDIFENHNVKPTAVRKFGKNAHSRIYLIEFKKQDMNKDEIKNIRYVLNYSVKWEKYTPKPRGPTQCNRCHMLGHGATYCRRKAVCSYCAEPPHLPGTECPHSIIRDGMPIGQKKCLNCLHFGRKADHSPRDVDCPSRIAYERMRAKNNNKRKNLNNNKHTEYDTIQPTINTSRNNFKIIPNNDNQIRRGQLSRGYADAVIGNNNNNANDQVHSPIASGAQDLLSGAELFKIFQQALSQLNACKTKSEQLAIVANLLAQCM